MDSLRYMMNKDMQKREETIKSDIEKTENKIVASQAVKKAIEKQKRVQKHKEQQEKEQERGRSTRTVQNGKFRHLKKGMYLILLSIPQLYLKK